MPIIECESCGREAEHMSHQWCSACYFRWYRAGQDGLPPMTIAERKETYFEILDQGATREEAAKRVDRSVKTAKAYERERRKHEQEGVEILPSVRAGDGRVEA